MVPAMTATVRVTGIRNGKFVEFEFSLGDSDLSVDLIMPFAAFEEFCRDRGAIVLPSADGADVPMASSPGLYRPPGNGDFNRDFPAKH